MHLMIAIAQALYSCLLAITDDNELSEFLLTPHSGPALHTMPIVFAVTY